MVQKTNLSVLVSTGSWAEQFSEALQVSAGKRGQDTVTNMFRQGIIHGVNKYRNNLVNGGESTRGDEIEIDERRSAK